MVASNVAPIRERNAASNRPAVVAAAMAGLFFLTSCSGARVRQVNFPLSVHEDLRLAAPGGLTIKGLLGAPEADDDVVSALAWSPDGSRLAAAVDYGTKIRVWDSSGKQLSEFDVGAGTPDIGNPIAFVVGSSELIFGPPKSAGDDVVLSLRDALTGQVTKRIEGPEPGSGWKYNAVSNYRVSPDQRLLAVSTVDRGSKGFDVAVASTGDWSFTTGSKAGRGAMSLNFFDRGRKLVVGSIDGVVTVVDVTTPTRSTEFTAFDVPQGALEAVDAVAGSADGELIFAGDSGDPRGSARVFRTIDHSLFAWFPPSLCQLVREAEWDPRDRYVAFLDHSDHLFLWQPVKGELRYAEITLPGAISLSIAPQGDRIAVARSGLGISVISVGEASKG